MEASESVQWLGVSFGGKKPREGPEYNYIDDLRSLREQNKHIDKPDCPHCVARDRRRKKAEETVAREGPGRDEALYPRKSEDLYFQIKFKELVDRVPTVPHIYRAYAAFDILDEIIPLTGPYATALGMIRAELFDCVFSDDVTSKEDRPYYHKIPYFGLCKRINLEKLEHEHALLEEADQLKRALREKTLQVESLTGDLVDSRRAVRERDLALEASAASVETAHRETQRLQEKLAAEKESQLAVEREMQAEVDDLHLLLRAGKEEQIVLAKYKDTYETLDKIFVQGLSPAAPMSSALTGKAKEDLNRWNLTRSELAQARRLRAQLDRLRGTEVENYELQMQRSTDPARRSDMRRVFAKEMEAVQTECRQLTNRIKRLEHALASSPMGRVLAAGKHWRRWAAHRVSVRRRGGDPDNMSEPSGGSGVNTPRDGSPTPRATASRGGPGQAAPASTVRPDKSAATREMGGSFPSRYAAVMQVSDDRGATFKTFPGTTCARCGDAVLLCPHTMLESAAITLPAGATHIRLARPTLVVAHETAPADSGDGVPASKDVHMVVVSATTTAESNEGVPLWAGFRERSFAVPATPRDLTLSGLRQAIESVYEWKLANDCDEFTLTPPRDFQTCLYMYLEEKYVVRDVMEVVAHAVLHATEAYCLLDKNVYLFCRLMERLEVDALFGQLIVTRKILHSIDWSQSLDFKLIAVTLYPFAEAQEIQQMITDFRLVNGRVTEEDINNYIVDLSLSRQEFRWKKMLEVVQKFDVYMHGWLSLQEFKDCMEMAFTKSFIVMATRHYKAAETPETRDRVSLVSLARILPPVQLAVVL